MNRFFAVAVLAAGVLLLVLGFDAGDSLSSEFSEAVSGTPTDKSIWLIVLGLAGVIIGGLGLLRRRA